MKSGINDAIISIVLGAAGCAIYDFADGFLDGVTGN